VTTKPLRASSDPRRLAQASQWLLGLCIAGSALAVGTVHTSTLCIVAIVVGVSTTLAWWNADAISVRPAATLLLLAGSGLIAYTAIQCVPMPMHWLAVLAPHNAAVWSRVLSPLHESGPRWAPITLDPNATRVEVLKGVTYLLTFITALRIARQRSGSRFLSGAIVLTGLVLAAAALLHPAFGAHRLFGLYEPMSQISARHIAPLMNPNNLAGYLNVAICLALSTVLSPEPVVAKPIAAAAVAVLGATQMWVASRGGVVTMVLGVLLVFAIARTARSNAREGTGVATLTILAGICAAAGGALIVLGGSDEASSELLTADVSKLTMLRHVMGMLPAVPVFGCGRGAFESAFAAYRVDPGYVTYAYPENVVAQWILEWGLPLGLGGLLTVAFALRPGGVLARSTTASGAWAALVALSVQNLGDLGSEIPAVALAGSVCAAIVVAGTPGHKPRWRVEYWARVPRTVAVASAAAAGLATLVAAAGVGRELHDDERALYNTVLERPVSPDAMHEEARAAMLRHPAEPYLPFITSLWASSLNKENPIPWIGGALERSSVYGPAHLVLARVLARRSPSQARMEYRLAIEQAPELDVSTMSETPRLVGGYFDAMELVPSGQEGERVLEMLVGAISERLPATRVRLDEELAARAPERAGPRLRAARDAVEDVEAGDGAPWCTGPLGPACIPRALAKARLAEQAAPSQCYPYVLHARAAVAAGETAAALKELQAAADSVLDRVTCLQALAEMARRTGDNEHAETALGQIVKAGCTDDGECARQLVWVASQQEAIGNRSTALSLYKRAHDRAPDDDSVVENVARLAAGAGLHAEAAETYDGLAKRHPADARWPDAASKQRQAAVKEALKL
jgi:hypothetical protein